MILTVLGAVVLLGIAGFIAWDRYQMCTALIEGSLRKHHVTDIKITVDWLDVDRDTFTCDVEYRDRAGKLQRSRCKVRSRGLDDEDVYWTDPIDPPSRS